MVRFVDEWAITPNLAGAVEAVRYWVGDVIRRAGGHDSQYVECTISVQLVMCALNEGVNDGCTHNPQS